MERLITDPPEINEAEITGHINQGREVVLQFSGKSYTPAFLDSINQLCERFDERLTVRFFAHYESAFDCRWLRHLPFVKALNLDCLTALRNTEELADLKFLRKLSLGVYELDEPDILRYANLRGLVSLYLCDTKRNSTDLSPLADFSNLRKLLIVGHTKNLDAVRRLKNLEDLYLSQIKNTVKLDFVCDLDGLRSLSINLGGRTNIAEISHPKLTFLRVSLVRGFEFLDPAAFPGLEHLYVGDQIRMKSLQFTQVNNRLRRIEIWNCKGLSSLPGLRDLGELRELQILQTSLDLNKLIVDGLPRKLHAFSFRVVKATQDRLIRTQLDQMGYKEFH